jgi:hypothetical protein
MALNHQLSIVARNPPHQPLQESSLNFGIQVESWYFWLGMFLFPAVLTQVTDFHLSTTNPQPSTSVSD